MPTTAREARAARRAAGPPLHYVGDLLGIGDDLVAAALSFAPTDALRAARATCKACRDAHVPAAVLALKQRLGAVGAVRGACTVSAGHYHTLLVRAANGAALACGGGDGIGDDFEYLGNGQERGPLVRVPAPMVGLGGVVVREVSAGGYHSLLLGACGGVWSCGAGWLGRLGHGDEGALATPRRVAGLAHVRAVQVAAGGFHSLVVTAAGGVYSFGDGGDAALGHGDRANQLAPRRVGGLLADARVCQVSAGGGHSLAVDEDGMLYAWGSGAGGRLGLGEARAGDQLSPAAVALPGGARIAQASAGNYHSLAVDRRGFLYSFGYGMYGGGHGDEERRWTPTRVAALEDTRVRAAAAGAFHSVVLTEASAVLTCGSGSHGQLGHGDEADRLVLTAVAALAGEVVAEVAAGGCHTVVRLAGSGALRAFGDNACGQLGTGAAPGARWREPEEDEFEEGGEYRVVPAAVQVAAAAAAAP